MNHKNRQFLLVTHRKADFDALVSIFLFMLIYKLKMSEVKLFFVEKGARYTEEVPDGYTVVHLDTGNRLDPTTWDYDHHQNRKKYPSAARAILEAHPNYIPDKWIEQLVELTDRVDSGNKIQESDHLKKSKQVLIDEIDQLNQRYTSQLRLIHSLPGPHHLVESFYDLSLQVTKGKLSERERIAIGLMSLDGWYDKKVNMWSKMRLFVERAGKRVERNGLRFLLLPPHEFESRDLRYYLRRYYFEELDVVVTEYENEGDVIGVTLIKESRVKGMTDLSALLIKMTPGLDIFLFEPSHFVMYIQPNPSISLEQVWYNALDVLHHEDVITIETRPDALASVN